MTGRGGGHRFGTGCCVCHSSLTGLCSSLWWSMISSTESCPSLFASAASKTAFSAHRAAHRTPHETVVVCRAAWKRTVASVVPVLCSVARVCRACVSYVVCRVSGRVSFAVCRKPKASEAEESVRSHVLRVVETFVAARRRQFVKTGGGRVTALARQRRLGNVGLPDVGNSSRDTPPSSFLSSAYRRYINSVSQRYGHRAQRPPRSDGG